MTEIMVQKQKEQLASLETLYVEYPYIFTYLILFIDLHQIAYKTETELRVKKP